MKRWKYKYRDTVSVTLVYEELEKKEVPHISATHSASWSAPICYPNGYEDGVECWIYTDLCDFYNVPYGGYQYNAAEGKLIYVEYTEGERVEMLITNLITATGNDTSSYEGLSIDELQDLIDVENGKMFVEWSKDLVVLAQDVEVGM